MGDLVNQQGAGALANPNSSMMGFENFNQSQLKMPRFKLVQNTSAEGKPGTLVNNLTGEEYSSVKGTLLGFVHKRVKWPEKYKRGDKPLCRSNDAMVSDDGKQCRNCPDAKWGENGEKPACSGVIEFIGMTADQDPFFIGAHGMSIAPINKWLTWAQLKHRPLANWKVEIVTKEDKNDQGKYFVLNIQNIKDDQGNNLVTTPEEMEDLKDVYLGLMEILKKAASELDESPDEAYEAASTNTAASDGKDPF